MVKPLLKAPPPWGQFSFPETVCSLLEKAACIFFMVKGLLCSIQLNSRVKYHWQVIWKLKFKVDVALIYVCKAFWQEINTSVHQRHCQDSSRVKSQHLSPAMSPLSPDPSGHYCLQVIQRGMNENPYHTGWMYSLIWVFASHTGLTVGFNVRWLIWYFHNSEI